MTKMVKCSICNRAYSFGLNSNLEVKFCPLCGNKIKDLEVDKQYSTTDWTIYGYKNFEEQMNDTFART